MGGTCIRKFINIYKRVFRFTQAPQTSLATGLMADLIAAFMASKELIIGTATFGCDRVRLPAEKWSVTGGSELVDEEDVLGGSNMQGNVTI